MAKKKRKIRASFRKNRTPRVRRSNWTREYESHGFEDDETDRGERVSGKGDLTRKRTVIGVDADESAEHGFGVVIDVNDEDCRRGRVLAVHGLFCEVEDEAGEVYRCATRRLLKTLATDQRHVVAAGDRVVFRTASASDDGVKEGIIERIEPRHGVLSRNSRGLKHVMVANVDQILIVTSAREPQIKPHLIDRMLVSAEQSKVRPVICINKVDLVDTAELQPLVGVYSQMGYRVLLLSAETGRGIDTLRRIVVGKASVVAGQSGVGKSSLLNAVEPGLDLQVKTVSDDTQKGRHTTTSARLIGLRQGGYVVDTPGIRQFALWDVIPEEVAGLFRDLRVFVGGCRYPDCTHTHEDDCAVKNAVADDLVDARRYESFFHLVRGDRV